MSLNSENFINLGHKDSEKSHSKSLYKLQFPVLSSKMDFSQAKTEIFLRFLLNWQIFFHLEGAIKDKIENLIEAQEFSSGSQNVERARALLEFSSSSIEHLSLLNKLG